MKISFSLFVLLTALFSVAAYDDFATCDFDMVPLKEEPKPGLPVPWRREYFVGICNEVYANKASEPAMFEEFAREAKAFRDFTTKLETYEVKKTGQPLCYDGQYVEDIDLRRRLYQEARLYTCYEQSARDKFLKCLRNKRKEMMAKIPNA